jgi:hypothetical protein
MPGERLTVFNQFGPQFKYGIERFQVVAAHLAGHITRPAGLTFINDVQDPVRVVALSFQE